MDYTLISVKVSPEDRKATSPGMALQTQGCRGRFKFVFKCLPGNQFVLSYKDSDISIHLRSIHFAMGVLRRCHFTTRDLQCGQLACHLQWSRKSLWSEGDAFIGLRGHSETDESKDMSAGLFDKVCH